MFSFWVSRRRFRYITQKFSAATTSLPPLHFPRHSLNFCSTIRTLLLPLPIYPHKQNPYVHPVPPYLVLPSSRCYPCFCRLLIEYYPRRITSLFFVYVQFTCLRGLRIDFECSRQRHLNTFVYEIYCSEACHRSIPECIFVNMWMQDRRLFDPCAGSRTRGFGAERCFMIGSGLGPPLARLTESELNDFDGCNHDSRLQPVPCITAQGYHISSNRYSRPSDRAPSYPFSNPTPQRTLAIIRTSNP